jgi:hypothetical protein
MLRLFDCAGLAARVQIGAVLLVGTILVVMEGIGLSATGDAYARPELLKWMFLAAAAVAAVSFRQRLSQTAARVSKDTDLVMRGRAKRLQIGLLLNLRLATGAVAVLTITPAPDLLVRALEPLIDTRVVQFLWAGSMSVGVAYFGAAASAARRVVRASKHAARTSA